MKQIVIDANVVAKWFIEEENSTKARLLREKFIEKEIELVTPSLLYFEVLNALKYSKLFNQEELNNAGESLENYGFNVITIKKKIREQIVKIAVEHDLSIYDASYIGLSIAMETILCTADEKIIKKLPQRLKKYVISLNKVEEILN
jgi:predicted nucleic acid-binding protein